MPGTRLAFGPFVLNPESGTLLRQGLPVPVGYRGILLLAALLKKPGEVITKSALLDAAWQGLTVEEGNLTVQVALLRKLLGRSTAGEDWIATVPRVGYRFTGEVEALPNAPTPKEPEQAVPARPVDRRLALCQSQRG